jgi:hypothetical protein
MYTNQAKIVINHVSLHFVTKALEATGVAPAQVQKVEIGIL